MSRDESKNLQYSSSCKSVYFICPTEGYLHIKGTVVPKQFELRYVMMTDVLHCPEPSAPGAIPTGFCPRDWNLEFS